MLLACSEQGVFGFFLLGSVGEHVDKLKFHIDYVAGLGGDLRQGLIDFRARLEEIAVAVSVKKAAGCGAFDFASFLAQKSGVKGRADGVIIFSVEADIAFYIFAALDNKAAEANCRYDNQQHIDERKFSFFHKINTAFIIFSKKPQPPNGITPVRKVLSNL